MRAYQFQALSQQGQKICGVIPADDQKQAWQRLKSRRLQPIRLHPKRFLRISHNPKGTWTIEWASDMGFFLRQGLPLLESLQSSKLRLTSSQKQLIDLIIEELYGGMPLSRALQQHGMFAKLFVCLLEVAEATGQYAQAFEDYALLRTEEQRFFKQLRSSLQYPLILSVVILGMVFGFSEFLLPNVVEFFAANHLTQPLITKLFIQFAAMVKSLMVLLTNWQLLMGISIGIYLVCRFTNIKYYLGWLIIKLPIFGTVYLQMMQSLYLKSFAMLVCRGHHVLLAVNYSGEILYNQYLRRQATYIDSAIQQTGKIGISVANFLKLAPPLANLLQIGEQTAQLAVYSEICAKFLKNQANAKLRAILTWTGPLLIFTMGVIMMWMVVAVVLPLYDQITRMD